MAHSPALPAVHSIQHRIFIIRGFRVLLDFDLALLYGVPTKRLKEQVRRNMFRFPADFMFELSAEESRVLRSQIASSSMTHGGRRYRPFAFTEQGVAMLSSILTSTQAVSVNIEIMRAFVRLRHLIESNKDMARRIDELEKKYDERFAVVFRAIRQLMEPPVKAKRKIGY